MHSDYPTVSQRKNEASEVRSSENLKYLIFSGGKKYFWYNFVHNSVWQLPINKKHG
jgi:hypothetical protein